MSDSEPGLFIRFIRSTLGFRKTTLTFLVVLSYLLAILVNLYFDIAALTPPTPEPEILSQSWNDLQRISSDLHPYDSHANDNVHDYLLERVAEISSKKSYFNYTDDYGNLNTIFNQQDVFDPKSLANRIIYFESGNILVKIEGKDPSLEGILISAHYDSVPTAYGTTDDGMGIASMLGLIEHFSAGKTAQPDRTLVFNFNNNEEFGLLGAEAFFKHEWSKLTSYFINLEGTGAGGKSILFRSTDVGILSYYSAAERPFANSIFQQGFQSGFIKSQTDYKIYTENGLRGVDIAFYKPRSLYHTLRDSISGSSKGSLWHMEKNTLDMVNNLAYETDIVNNNLSKGVFFDVLGLVFFYISVDTLCKWNAFILAIVPIVISLLLVLVAERGTWYVDLGKGWLRFPISLAASYYLTQFVSKYLYFNDPLLLSQDYYSPLLALTSLNVLSNYAILNFTSWFRPVHDQKLIVLLELNLLVWCLTLWMTLQQQYHANVAGYGLTLVYCLISSASIFGLLALLFKAKEAKYKKTMTPRYYGSLVDDTENNETSTNSHHTVVDSENHPLLGGDSSSIITSSNQNDGPTPSTNSNGQTILVIDHESEDTYKNRLKSTALKSFSYDWSFQFLMLVPISIFIIFTEGELVLSALNQTVQESSDFGVTTMNILVAVASCLAVPILPFIHKLNSVMVLFFVSVLSICSIISYLEDPYSYAHPLKFRFLETINLTSEHSLNSTQVDSTVELFGRAGYMESILSNIPSVHTSKTSINCSAIPKSGNELCQFSASRPWLVDGSIKENSFDNYLNVEIISNSNDGKTNDKYSPFEAELKINVKDNRNCVVNFNSSKYNSKDSANNKKLISPVKLITIYNESPKDEEDAVEDPSKFKKGNKQISLFMDDVNQQVSVPTGYSTDEDGNHYFKLMKGIDELQLHKLNWTQPSYHLSIQWLPFTFDDDSFNDIEEEKSMNNLGLNIKCYWGEYDESVNVGDSKLRKIPAFDELLKYSPDYITYSNLAKGLVEITDYVEL